MGKVKTYLQKNGHQIITVGLEQDKEVKGKNERTLVKVERAVKEKKEGRNGEFKR